MSPADPRHGSLQTDTPWTSAAPASTGSGEHPKVLAISTSYFPFNGGQEIGLQRLLHHMRRRFRVAVLTPRYHPSHAPRDEVEGVVVHRYNSCPIRYPSEIVPESARLLLHTLYGFLFLHAHIRALRPDFVLVYFLTPSGLPAVHSLLRLRLPFAVFIGGSDVHHSNPLVRATSARALRSATRIIATSAYLRDNVVRRFHLDRDRTQVIPYGLPLQEFPFLPKTVRPPVRLLCVQRLIPSKGTRDLILALGSLGDLARSSLRLDIIGDGSERNKLEHLTRRLSLSEVVRFHGALQNRDVTSFYTKSHVFVFPTLSEGFGIVLLEAMATNNIIVASDCTAVPETIRHGSNGLLCRPGDPKDLARTLAEIVRHPAAFAPLAKQAHEDVQRYDVPVVGEEICRVVDMALGGGHHSRHYASRDDASFF